MDIGELAGQTIEGRYELEALLGAGAMGAVYRARQNVVNRSVAVKILHPDIVREDPDFRRRFEREAEALGKLEHPNLVTVHDFGWWPSGQTPYMVTQFAGGQSLHALMPRHLGDQQFAVSMLLEIARGLAHAHSRGVLHRDMKPENVVVNLDEDAVKIVDFGLAYLRADDDNRLTQAGDVFGTPAYMSPEQCQGRKDITAACDVYALGVMAFELAEGRLPFESPRKSALMIQHVTKPAPEVSEHLAGKPYRELVAEMMRKSPDERPTAAQVGERLEAILDAFDPQSTAHPQPESGPKVDSGTEPESVRETVPATRPNALDTDIASISAGPVRRFAPAILVVLAIVVGAALWSWQQPDDSEPTGGPASGEQADRGEPAATDEPEVARAAATFDAGSIARESASEKTETDPSAEPSEGDTAFAAPPDRDTVDKPVDKLDDSPRPHDEPDTEEPGEEAVSEPSAPPTDDERDAGHRTIRLRY